MLHRICKGKNGTEEGREDSNLAPNCNFLDQEPRLYDLEKKGQCGKPAEDLKEVMISQAKHQKTKIGTASMEENVHTQPENDLSEDVATWTLFVDGSFNPRGSGAGVTLEGPDGMLMEKSLRFN